MSQEFPGVPQVDPQPVKMVRAFRVFDGKQYQLLTNAQAIATAILTLPPGVEMKLSVMEINPRSCDLTEIFDAGGFIASPKPIT